MKTILVFSHLRWNFVFQRPQHLLSRLAQHYRIIFVEEPIHTIGLSRIQATVVEPNIMVLVPHTSVDGWGFSDKQLEVMAPLVKNWLQEHVNLDDGYGIWFYTPQPLLMKDVFAPEFIVFDVMDELALFKGAPPELKEREAELLKVADIVIAGGPSLHASKSVVRPDTINLPSAVDASHFSRVHAEEVEAISHYEEQLEWEIPHPRIGFFGVIDERLDIDLIAKIADHDPHWHVVMVGPVVKIDPATLPQRHNIHWLGQQDYAVLPQLVHEWDVCMLPFALNDSTKFISPTKTLEYLAAEKPVVSTAINDVKVLYGSVVEIGNTHAEFIEHIEALLEEDPVARSERVRNGLAIVNKSSWDSAAEVVHQAIEGVLKSQAEGRANSPTY